MCICTRAGLRIPLDPHSEPAWFVHQERWCPMPKWGGHNYSHLQSLALVVEGAFLLKIQKRSAQWSWANHLYIRTPTQYTWKAPSVSPWQVCKEMPKRAALIFCLWKEAAKGTRFIYQCRTPWSFYMGRILAWINANAVKHVVMKQVQWAGLKFDCLLEPLGGEKKKSSDARM